MLLLLQCIKSGPHLDDALLHLRHEYDDIVEGNLHLHIGGGDNCAEIFVTGGNAERVSDFIGNSWQLGE
ncbi:MAG: hypothetical protein WAK17_26005 [Candidatus Nitrosopolaris sp.]